MGSGDVLHAEAVGISPSNPVPPDSERRLDICGLLSLWADVAGVSSNAGTGMLAVAKSDLLGRLVYGGERGPSRTKCPVHDGKWMGCHFGWPGSVWRNAEGDRPMDVDRRLQEWWDAGCRCATHAGSTCTTGWNPDENCCLPAARPTDGDGADG